MDIETSQVAPTYAGNQIMSDYKKLLRDREERTMIKEMFRGAKQVLEVVDYVVIATIKKIKG